MNLAYLSKVHHYVDKLRENSKASNFRTNFLADLMLTINENLLRKLYILIKEQQEFFIGNLAGSSILP